MVENFRCVVNVVRNKNKDKTMKMKKTEAFKPCVTMEEVFAFDPERAETFTKSPLMNAVLTAVKREKLTTQKEVADFLKVNSIHLGGAVQIILGLTFNKMRDQLLRHIIGQLQKEHPDWEKKQLAEAIGYSDHSSLWRLFHREFDHRYYKEWRDGYVEHQKERELQLLKERKERQGNNQ